MSTVAKKKKGKKREPMKRQALRMLIVVLAVVAAACFIIFWKVFTIQTITVKGNQLHSKKAIEKQIVTGKMSWNSLFLLLKYKFKDADLPYISDVQITLKTPHDVVIHVTEDEPIGYVYDKNRNQYAYIDQNAKVLLLTSKVRDNTMQIFGLKFEGAALYQKMKIKSTAALTDIQSISRLAEKYDIVPDAIMAKSTSDLVLKYGKIQVNLGDTSNLNEKMVRVQNILPKLKKMKVKGTLHLETWSESTTDIYFRKNETVKFPTDEKVVTDSRTTSDSNASSDSSASSDSKSSADSNTSSDGNVTSDSTSQNTGTN